MIISLPMSLDVQVCMLTSLLVFEKVFLNFPFTSRLGKSIACQGMGWSKDTERVCYLLPINSGATPFSYYITEQNGTPVHCSVIHVLEVSCGDHIYLIWS